MMPLLETAFEWWDLQLPLVPARSRLYPLEPIGLGSPTVESLTSYVARLAEAHSAPVGKLVKRELLPRFGRPTLLTHITPFWHAYARALNGINTWSRDLVRILQTLTHRQDLDFLTVLPWAAVLSSYDLLRHQRAWCPVCLATWRQAGQIIYEPLLWSIALVTCCPIHQQQLSQCCPHCQESLNWLEPKMQPGYCSRCYRWLGASPELRPATALELPQPEQAWQSWLAQVMGDLLTAAPRLPLAPKREKVAQVLSGYITQLAAGKSARFSKLLRAHHVQLSEPSLSRWQLGKILPRVKVFLQLCYCLDTSPLQFFTADTITVPAQLRSLRLNEADG
jgi:hypothetical protein